MNVELTHAACPRRVQRLVGISFHRYRNKLRHKINRETMALLFGEQLNPSKNGVRAPFQILEIYKSMKKTPLIALLITISAFADTEAFEPISVDLEKNSVSHSVLDIASVHNINIIIPESAFTKEISIAVKNKNPIEIIEAIAVASGYELNEVNGIYIFADRFPDTATPAPSADSEETEMDRLEKALIEGKIEEANAILESIYPGTSDALKNLLNGIEKQNIEVSLAARKLEVQKRLQTHMCRTLIEKVSKLTEPK